ncbi:MAG TPA: hypothetical protein VGW58_08065 [Pyrinomonadaceae bacterium]|nr:hypothetical protein [Pyrinomonadaceae bacterium]
MRKTVIIGAVLFCLAATSFQAQQTRKWGLTWGRYDTSRKGYGDIPLQVLAVPGGKLGPKEKFRIFVSKLKNRTEKRIIAARFSWILFETRDLNKVVQTAQTDLINLNIDGNHEADVEIDVINLEDIPFLQENPQGVFHLEVVASEVRYDDGSIWKADNIPGPSRRTGQAN